MVYLNGAASTMYWSPKKGQYGRPAQVNPGKTVIVIFWSNFLEISILRLFQILMYRLSQIAGITAGLILTFIVLFILTEIVLRTFLSSSTYVLDEFVGYALGALIFLSLGYTLENDQLIRVNLLLSKVTSRVRRLLEVIAATLTLVLSTFFAWFFWLRIERHWSRDIVSNTIAEVPMWIPESLLLVGIIIFWLQTLAYLLRMLFLTDEMAHPYAKISRSEED